MFTQRRSEHQVLGTELRKSTADGVARAVSVARALWRFRWPLGNENGGDLVGSADMMGDGQ